MLFICAVNCTRKHTIAVLEVVPFVGGSPPLPLRDRVTSIGGAVAAVRPFHSRACRVCSAPPPRLAAPHPPYTSSLLCLCVSLSHYFCLSVSSFCLADSNIALPQPPPQCRWHWIPGPPFKLGLRTTVRLCRGGFASAAPLHYRIQLFLCTLVVRRAALFPLVRKYFRWCGGRYDFH